MHNDSIETLLARHYGSTAVAPSGLEQRLQAAVRQQTAEMAQEQTVVTRIRTSTMSRRRVVQLVALSSLSLGIVNLGIEGLQSLEASVMGQSVATP